MRSLTFISIIISVLFGQFDNSGTSAANFLKIGVGGRAAAMGGAIVGNIDGPNSMFWNPAGIANAKGVEFSINQNNWILDLKHSYFAVIFPGGNIGHIGFSVNYLDMGRMSRTTEFEPEGTGTTFTASDVAIGFTFAKHMSDRFNAGIQLKLVQESISFTSARAIAIDAGSQYITRFSGLKIGMAITNFGTKMRLNGTDQKVDVDAYEDLDGNPDVIANLRTEDWPLPMAFRVGLSIKPIGPESVFKSNKAELTVNTDYYDSRDLNPYYLAGFELKLANLIFLRTGLKHQYTHLSDEIDDTNTDKIGSSSSTDLYVTNWSWGVGLSSESFPLIPYRFTIDYSVSDLGILGLSTQLGITFRL
tara:strand:+ start:598 stop:1680 length:1083 start_codon:yes stop_codon:yes gene_type:complete